MSDHRARLEWRHDGTEFTYDSYSRNHRWIFENGVEVAASAAPAFLGDGEMVDPEEAFVASVASCHMLSFLAIAARKRMTVLSYADDAVGTLAENDEGRLSITEVVLRPRIEFAEPLSADKLAKLHDAAHRVCFIANSVRSTVRVEAD